MPELEGVVDVDLSGYVPEQVITDISRPYELAITHVAMREYDKKDKSGNPTGAKGKIISILASVKDSDLENPKTVEHVLFAPDDSMTTQEANRAKGQVIRFLMALGYDEEEVTQTGFPPVAELKGATFTATLKLKRDAEYGDKNVVKRIIS